MTEFAQGQPQDASANANVVLTADVSGYQRSMAQAAQQTNAMSASLDSLVAKASSAGHALAHAFTNVGKGGLGMLGGAAADAAAFEKQLSTLAATSKVTGVSMGSLTSGIESAFTKFPVARGQVVALVQAITNLGVTAPSQIGSLTQTFIKLGSATGESMTGLATGLIQFSREMGNTNASQIGNFANSLLTVSKTAGVSASGVLSFSQAIAPLARQAGIGEAAVLGIATAFQKSGADGYYAANTFNSIISDITTLTQTGSPQLAKYASFIGMTTDAFRKLPSKDQIVDIFNAISRGGPQALNFLQGMGLGTRALSSVQAVAQTGGLGQAINQAMASSTDQGNLNKGSAAAMGGFVNALTRARNGLTQLGDEVGAPLLKVLTPVVNAFTDLEHVVGIVARTLGPLAPAFAAIGSIASMGVGFGLAHAGTIGTLALGRMLLSPNSGPRVAFREGRQVGLGGAMEDTYFGGRLAAGESVPLRARMAFGMGSFSGRMFGEGGATGVGFLGRGASYAARATGMGLFGVPAWFLGQQRRTMQDSMVPFAQRSAYAKLGHLPTNDVELAAMNASVKARLAESGVIKLTAQEMAALGKQVVGLGADAAKAAASMAEAAMIAGGSSMGGKFGAVAGTAARGVGMLGRGLGRLGSLALGPVGMAAMIGIPLVSELISTINSKHAATNENNTIADLNPIQQYNAALGIATGKLADFSTGLQNATPKAGTQSTATSFTGAAQVTPSDVGQYAGTGSKDQTINALARHDKGDVQAGIALMASYGITDPKQLDLFKQNLLASGWDPGKVQQVMNAYKPGMAVNYSALGRAINKTEATGMLPSNISATGNRLIAAGLTPVGVQFATDQTMHSEAYAQTHRLQSGLAAISGMASQAGNMLNTDEVGNMLGVLTKAYGGSQDAYSAVMAKHGKVASATTFDQAKFAKMDPQQQQQYLLTVLKATKAGSAYLKAVTGSGGTINPVEFSTFLAKNAALPSGQASMLAGYGALGRYVGSSPGVAYATGLGSGSPSAVQAAIAGVGSKALTSAGSVGQATESLMRLSDAMGSTQTATGSLLASASAWIRQMQSYQLPGMSRNAQIGALVGNLNASSIVASAPGASQASQDTYKSDLAAYEQQKESYRQYLVSTYQQADQFHTQMVRAAEDEQTNIYRSQRNFYVQMTQAQQDYQKQTSRSREDFAIQEQRQAQQAAQSIYDPFSRIQSKYTTDAGTLLQNLQVQNTAIQQQYAQLGQLRKMGVSQQAIDTLNLSDASQAQQVNTLVGSLANDPALVGKINKAVGTRVQATTSLTQSSFSMTFRNTVSDFQRGLDRAAQDYQTSHDRAVQAQATALGDMATDYNKMISRSAEDLQKAMTEITGNFGQMFGKTMSVVNSEVARYAPGAAAIIDTELTQLKDKYPMLFDPNYVGTGYQPIGTGPGAGGVAGGRTMRVGMLADGGITTRPTLAMVSEAGSSEAHIPLNSQGEQFMAGLITRSLAQAIVMAAKAAPAPVEQRMSADYSVSYAGANIQVVAPDPNKMERDLEAKRKLKRLTSPGRR